MRDAILAATEAPVASEQTLLGPLFVRECLGTTLEAPLILTVR